MNSNIRIREETEEDLESICRLNSSVFETDAEAKLVDTLRERGQAVISLVAETAVELVGHILFSPVSLVGKPEIGMVGLAPMAVASEFQNTGIGSLLVQVGLEYCRTKGYHALVVLGHPDYYPRFGFVPSSKFGIMSEYEVSEEFFMALELVKNSLKGACGVVSYHAAFTAV